jgi:hypothetical protein
VEKKRFFCVAPHQEMAALTPEQYNAMGNEVHTA